MQLADAPGHIENWWRGVALLAKRAIAAAVHVIFADVVLTS